jgi:pyruvate,water dikinase
MTLYLNNYGLRCANELKLESYSYHDQPHRLYQIIRSYLTVQDPSSCSLGSIEQRERTIRQTAEQQAYEGLQESRSWLPRRMLFRWVLKNARRGIRNRENMRFARTRIYGILRRMLRSIGRQFAEQDILDEREDIFYLTIEELWDFVKGTAVTTDLRGLVRFRRGEYEAYLNETAPPPADRFETIGLPYVGSLAAAKTSPCDADAGGALTGIGCCPGVVTGTVQVLADPSQGTQFAGEILVALRTDPGWVACFPAFSGILVERGSVLSHSAIVAREMGIPTIVGIEGLTRRIQSGQRVRMDGRTGEVQIAPDP